MKPTSYQLRSTQKKAKSLFKLSFIMLFHSHIYLLFFLPATVLIYFYLNRKRLTDAAKGFLVFASLFFYGWWNIAYIPLILGSMLLNYELGLYLSRRTFQQPVNAKILLSIGCIANIVLLAYYKYAGFLIQNLNTLTNWQITYIKPILPLAISFFTFTQIAYLVDSYRRETREYDFLNYALFVCFFPHLIAGPIVHHRDIMGQFAAKRNMVPNHNNIVRGLTIFSVGIFKKVVIADTFGLWASAGFDQVDQLGCIESWITSLSYTFQLYFDFSGYSDMAIGASLLFNIMLPINFNSPYKSLNIQDFWRRWHITLSQFLRDYIYFPMGGNRKGQFATYRNLFVTFLIGGVWHGAGWTFIFWGALHGAAMAVHRAWMQTGFKMHPLPAWFLTFNFVNFGWLFFRAKTWDDAVTLLNKMLDWSGGGSFNAVAGAALLVGAGLIMPPNSVEIMNKAKSTAISAVVIGFLFTVSLAVLEIRQASEFLYFQF